MNKQISIIVPVYKIEEYLEPCLRSILAKSYTDFKVILIDDCLPDGSGAICDRFAEADHRIRVIHKENQRVSAARNDGLALAKGEYVLWL